MQPLSIDVDKTNKIIKIGWDDQHQGSYEFGLLRAACPCASCRGGHENMKPDPDDDVFEKTLPDNEMTRIKEIELVGNYAISITWEDGHHYGIYNWYYLRKLCNCLICQNLRK